MVHRLFGRPHPSASASSLAYANPQHLLLLRQPLTPGGKICLLSLAKDVFHSGATCHPAMIANEDGDALKRPFAFYPSKDEPADVVQHIAAAIKDKPFAKECDYVLYDTV